MDIEAAAVAAGVSVRTIRRWLAEGRINALTIDEIAKQKRGTHSLNARLTRMTDSRAMLRA